MKNDISSSMEVQDLYRVGVALSVEKDINKLLDLIASVARRYTNAEGCTLYLCNEEQGCLDFSVVQNEKLGIYFTDSEGESDWPPVPLYLANDSENHSNVSAHCALTGEVIRISDVYNESRYDFYSTRTFDSAAGYRSRSMLLVPMKDAQGDVIGVLQLLNARSASDGTIIDFPEEREGLVKGLASQASISVVNVRLINRLKNFTSLGLALSAKKDIHHLFDMIATMARKYTRAEGCTLYLRNESQDLLEFAVIQNNKLNIFQQLEREEKEWPPIPLYLPDGRENHRNVSVHCLLTRKIVKIHDVYNKEGFDFSGTREFDAISNYRSQSMLLVPMTDHEDNVIGVLQLLNARKGISRKISDFQEEDIQLVSSLASQAAIAVTNVRLVKGMDNLLKSFVQCIAVAIDEKSPYTGGHIQRVAKLAEMMALGINESSTGPFADVHFTEDQMEEIVLAAWMHDIGKITTPEHVVDKATKLEAIFDRIELVRLRLELLRKEQEILDLRGEARDSRTETEERDVRFSEIYQFIRQVNLGGEFMKDEDLEELQRIAGLQFKLEGVTSPLLSENEIECCSIRKGTLTAKERKIINHHVEVTIKMLGSLPFLKKWEKVPEYAGMHHEKLDGSGYPKGKKGEDIALPARLLAVADIFEALTASDRPYRNGNTVSDALRILEDMVTDNHLDATLCDFLVESGIVNRYMRQHLGEHQRGDYSWKGTIYTC